MIFMLKDFYIHNSKVSDMAELTLNLGFIKFMEAIFHWEIMQLLLVRVTVLFNLLHGMLENGTESLKSEIMH